MPIYALVDTWNAAGTTFTGIGLNVTDTASAAGSLLLDLQVGGSSRFSVSKDGLLTFGSGGELVELFARGSETPGIGVPVFRRATANGPTALDIYPNGTGGTDATGVAWLHVLSRDLTGRPAALQSLWQTALVSCRRDGVSLGSMTSTGSIALTGASGTGTQITFTFANVGFATPFQVNEAITVSGVTPNGYNGNFIVVSSTATTVVVNGSESGAYTSGGTLAMRALPATFHGATVTLRSTQAGVSGSDFAYFDAAGVTLAGGASAARVIVTNGTTNGMSLAAIYPLSWESGTSGTIQYTTRDLFLHRDAADTFAQRRGTNAQAHRWYRSFTDASNYSRVYLGWSSSTAILATEGAGTGSRGNIAFGTAALATSATVGYVMIPSSAGAPTGVPADIPTGQVALHYDTSNNKIYVYNGGWVSTAALT
jgi:hypothetical protein